MWSRTREHRPSPQRGAPRYTPAVSGRRMPTAVGNPGQRFCRSDSFVSISGPLASPKRMSASASLCWPKAEPPRDERRPNGERWIEPACRPGSTPGRGTGETDIVCCPVVPSALPGVGIDPSPGVATSLERRGLASTRILDVHDRAFSRAAVTGHQQRSRHGARHPPRPPATGCACRSIGTSTTRRRATVRRSF